MSKPRLAVVMTTINDGEVLDGYCRQATLEGITDRIRLIVIPDRKTPSALYTRCKELAGLGIEIVCPSLSEQEDNLKRFGGLAKLIPYDSDNRRNVGFLMALEWGGDVLISLDDDNFCLTGSDTFEAHSVVSAEEVRLPAVHADTGWFNVCDLLEMEAGHSVYPRGFPYNQRCRRAQIRIADESGLVRMNAGLWLGEPDLDAMTWLSGPNRATAFRAQSVMLGQGTWSPINTQNTSLHRDLIVAFYFIRMGSPIAGISMGRYGDIFSGYFCQACVRHFGHRIRVGTPVALHRRNSHDYWDDLVQEIECIRLLEDLTPWLYGAKLQGNTYAEAYLSLASALEEEVEKFKGSIWTEGVRTYFHDMASCMRQWVDACQNICR